MHVINERVIPLFLQNIEKNKLQNCRYQDILHEYFFYSFIAHINPRTFRFIYICITRFNLVA